jgi:signal transduction histidine kinase
MALRTHRRLLNRRPRGRHLNAPEGDIPVAASTAFIPENALLGNALKFTPAPGRVMVALDIAGGVARLSVKDGGIGIDREFPPHVFEALAQAEGSTVRKYRGLGLGLAIVRHVVELHGGTVRAESEGPGKGATFTVVLPLADGAARAG